MNIKDKLTEATMSAIQNVLNDKNQVKVADEKSKKQIRAVFK